MPHCGRVMLGTLFRLASPRRCLPRGLPAAKLPAYGGGFEVTSLDEISEEQAGATSSKVNG